jgi:hypothetical protein
MEIEKEKREEKRKKDIEMIEKAIEIREISKKARKILASKGEGPMKQKKRK